MNYLNSLFKSFKPSRRFLSFCLLLLFLVSLLSAFSFPVFAEQFSLYSSVSPSDTIVKNLIGIYQNSPDYDPYNEFEVARVGQYDYRIFYGRDIDSSDYSYFQYYGVQSGVGAVNWAYAGGVGSSLHLIKLNYMTVGNVVNTIKSSEAESFKFQYVALGLAFFALIIFLYKVFRFKISSRPSRGWRI